MRWRRPLPVGKWVSRQVANKPLPLLIEANQLMAQNNYPAAAVIFEKIAVAAEGRNGPRAPIFYIQAGKARIFSGDVSTGMEHIRHGMTQLHDQKRIEQLNAVSLRITRELEDHSMIHESTELKSWMSALLNVGEISQDTTSSGLMNSSKALMPTDCPSCGGRIHPNEVVWIDKITIECAYCGRLIRSDAS